MAKEFFKCGEVITAIVMGRRKTKIVIELVQVEGMPLPVDRTFCEITFPIISVDEAVRNAGIIVVEMNHNIERINDWQENRKLDRDQR